MGERESYAPGTFSWASLGTSDDAAAVRDFYRRVLGWEAGEDGFRLGGKRVAGIHDGEPRWLSYVTVEDVAAATARAKELGGEVLGEPGGDEPTAAVPPPVVPAPGEATGAVAPTGDVTGGGEAGRGAGSPGDAEVTIRDPTGGTLRLSQAAAGAERVNDPGCMVWNELATADPERARAFYEELLGWGVEEDATGYAIIRRGAVVNGGIRPVQAGEAPSWLVYFAAARLDEAVAAVAAGGGSAVGGPYDSGIGRIVVAADPQGAVFALFEGPVDA